MSAEPTVADVLNRAADIIEERGLCRGRPEGEDGSVCVIHAIGMATAGRWWSTEEDMRDSAEDALKGLLFGDARASGLARWSDTKALDAADVANHLRKAAERWAERS